MQTLLVEPPVLFFADLHLGASQGVESRLERFLGRVPRNVKLVGLGDIVDYWIEGPTFDVGEEYPVLKLFRGRQAVFLPGNRDFLIGKRWEALTGGSVAADALTVELPGKKILCMHGDQLVRRDWRYQLWRKVCRSGPFAALAGTLPPDRARRAAGALRQGSRREVARKPREAMRIPLGAAAEAAAGHDLLVCGHVHEPSRQTWPRGELVTLGSWDRGAEILYIGERETRFCGADAFG